MLLQRIHQEKEKAEEIRTAQEFDSDLLGTNTEEINPTSSKQEMAEALARFCRINIRQAACEAADQTLSKSDKSQEIQALQNGLQSLESEIRQIRVTLGERLPRMSGLDELLNQHSKLLEDSWSQRVKDLFRGVVPILDRIEGRLYVLKERLVPQAVSRSPIVELSGFIKGIKLELLALLASQGIEPFITNDEDFSGKNHNAVKLIEAHSKSIDGKIAKRLHPGYRREGITLRRELVEVYRYTNNQADY